MRIEPEYDQVNHKNDDTQAKKVKRFFSDKTIDDPNGKKQRFEKTQGGSPCYRSIAMNSKLGEMMILVYIHKKEFRHLGHYPRKPLGSRIPWQKVGPILRFFENIF